MYFTCKIFQTCSMTIERCSLFIVMLWCTKCTSDCQSKHSMLVSTITSTITKFDLATIFYRLKKLLKLVKLIDFFNIIFLKIWKNWCQVKFGNNWCNCQNKHWMLVLTVTDALVAPKLDNEKEAPFHCHAVLLKTFKCKLHVPNYRKLVWL